MAAELAAGGNNTGSTRLTLLLPHSPNLREAQNAGPLADRSLRPGEVVDAPEWVGHIGVKWVVAAELAAGGNNTGSTRLTLLLPTSPSFSREARNPCPFAIGAGPRRLLHRAGPSDGVFGQRVGRSRRALSRPSYHGVTRPRRIAPLRPPRSDTESSPAGRGLPRAASRSANRYRGWYRQQSSAKDLPKTCLPSQPAEYRIELGVVRDEIERALEGLSVRPGLEGLPSPVELSLVKDDMFVLHARHSSPPAQCTSVWISCTRLDCRASTASEKGASGSATRLESLDPHRKRDGGTNDRLSVSAGTRRPPFLRAQPAGSPAG